jgi:probable phosphoglycerate mutase
MNMVDDTSPLGPIFLMRHGDSRKDTVRRYIGQSDDPLNERGREQADWWRSKLSPIRFRRVFCSDLARSMQTARIIMAGREGLISPHAGLREISMGDWEGLAMADLRADKPAEYAERGGQPDLHRPPGGESFADLENRVVPVIRDMASREQGTVLVVGHAGVNRVILCHVLGIPLRNLFLLGQDYGCLNLLGRGNGPLRVDALNLRPFELLPG